MHSGSLKIIGTGTDRSIPIYNFVLVLHSNYLPISYRFRDKWKYLKEKFPTPVHLTLPLTGFPWNFVTAIGLAARFADRI